MNFFFHFFCYVYMKSLIKKPHMKNTRRQFYFITFLSRLFITFLPLLFFYCKWKALPANNIGKLCRHFITTLFVAFLFLLDFNFSSMWKPDAETWMKMTQRHVATPFMSFFFFFIVCNFIIPFWQAIDENDVLNKQIFDLLVYAEAISGVVSRYKPSGER